MQKNKPRTGPLTTNCIMTSEYREFLTRLYDINNTALNESSDALQTRIICKHHFSK